MLSEKQIKWGQNHSLRVNQILDVFKLVHVIFILVRDKKDQLLIEFCFQNKVILLLETHMFKEVLLREADNKQKMDG